MSAERPLVTVITPAFNAHALLPETVRSVRSQTYVHYEHIIVDDRSDDGTRELIQGFAVSESRIRPIFMEQNAGPVVARNAAVAAARGKYVAFLDADDLWHPEKLERQVALMESTQCALSFTDYRHMAADGTKVGGLVRGPNQITLRTHYATRFFCCSAVMFNRALVPDFAFPGIAPAVRAEDFIAWARILREYGAARRCPHDLVRCRLLPHSRSAAKIRAVRSVWHLYRTIEQMPHLTALLYFLCFSVTASLKHIWAWPLFARRQF
jgi:teichuronic acid biosynthesis glycosyltransferase TuaG